ncbi:transmembrane protein, putative [Medicago truncatula]|uniref:Transmembrane protein, putative n=1 Tax=Medicago truncatula TaxID=3880 RepID=G7JV01_MEDTR|nr:transmembrane protein, putative [Medicago truncatula]
MTNLHFSRPSQPTIIRCFALLASTLSFVLAAIYRLKALDMCYQGCIGLSNQTQCSSLFLYLLEVSPPTCMIQINMLPLLQISIEKLMPYIIIDHSRLKDNPEEVSIRSLQCLH